jgi:hypothetical protein
MPDITASLTQEEMDLLEAYAQLHGVPLEEALKKAFKANIEHKFNLSKSDIRPFKRPAVSK